MTESRPIERLPGPDLGTIAFSYSTKSQGLADFIDLAKWPPVVRKNSVDAQPDGLLTVVLRR
jgi:hypothetical protein